MEAKEINGRQTARKENQGTLKKKKNCTVIDKMAHPDEIPERPESREVLSR